MRIAINNVCVRREGGGGEMNFLYSDFDIVFSSNECIGQDRTLGSRL